MSESILKAIIRLLVIVAKEDDEVTLDEKSTVLQFLYDNFAKDDAKKYYEFFESLIDKKLTRTDEEEIDVIGKQINQSQTNHQKIVIILKLVELIAADGTVSDRETELLYYITNRLNINAKIADLIKAFVIFQDKGKIKSSKIMIVDNGQGDVPDNCFRIVREQVQGFLFLLRIPEIDMYFTKYIGEDHFSLNGVKMKPNQVFVFPLGSIIKHPEASPLFYSDVVSTFRQTGDEVDLSFVAEDLSFRFSNGNIGLRNINIQEYGGKLIALMGGSGAGKSTLLNVLNGNESPSEGSVRINSINIHNDSKSIEGIIGYIPQDDLLVEELSVYENMFFAAKLCFKEKSKEALDELVVKTLESLGLLAAKDLKVGSPLEKSISGGQRKRLNIGLELLREPSVLFVDEPTSGLSSRDSENIMELLKELSLKGKMIFVVIHQPSEDIYKMFDKLILLDVGGYQVYYGNPIEGISYFKELTGALDNRASANPEQIFNILEAKVVDEFGSFTNQRKTKPEEWNDSFKEKITIESVIENTEVPEKTLDIPGRIKQFLIFMQRDSRSKLSNKQYLMVNFLEAPVLALILAFIIRYIPEDSSMYVFKENLNLPVYFFMSVIVALFMGLTVSAEEIIRDRKILKRESFLNLSRASYLASKIILLLSISAIQTITFVLIGNWILELKSMTFEMWLVLFSVASFANILGLNVSAAFKSAVTVYVLIPLLIIPQLILSGVVVSFDKLNPTITVENRVPMIGELMASRWAYEAMAVNQYKANPYFNQLYPLEKTIAQSEYNTVYYIPRMITDLDFAMNNKTSEPEEAAYRLKTVQNEISKQLKVIGQDKFPQIDRLTLDQLDEPLHQETLEFIDKLKSYFNLKSKKAYASKSEIMTEKSESLGSADALSNYRNTYENEAIGVLVKNTTTKHRILEHNNELIQKIYPIYNDPDPKHALDFRTQFYAPTKHFGGTLYDTLGFNVVIIWIMSVILIITLYFDVFKRLISGKNSF
jgi:ABC-type multidrug transport system ATPase subunit/tellurite resistance protein